MTRWLAAPLAIAFLVACDPSSAPTSSGASTITVSGTVVDGPGTPVFGARVFLGHDPAAVVTTGPDGRFTFTGVSTPYALGLAQAGNATLYYGLSEPAPRLTPNYVQYSAPVSGRVTGPTFPLPSGQAIVVAAKGVSASTLASATDGSYSTTALWDGSAAVTTDVMAVHVDLGPAGSSIIAAYHLSGKRAGVQLRHGVATTGLDVALTNAVPTSTTTVTLAPGVFSQGVLAIESHVLVEGVEMGYAFGGFTTGVASGTVLTYPTAGATVQLQGSTGTVMGSHRKPLSPGTTTVSLPVDPLLVASAPTPAGSRTPTLSWTAVPGASMYAVFVSSSGGSGPSYRFFVPGSTTSLQVPDLRALGLGLPPSTSYRWSVLAYVDPTIVPSIYVRSTGHSYDATGSASQEEYSFSSAPVSFTTGP